MLLLAASLLCPQPVPATAATSIRIDIDTEFSTLLQELVRAALQKNAESTEMDHAVERYQTRLERNKHGAKDLSLNYFGFPRGFDASREGAKLVLGEDQEIKSLEAAELFRQSRTDRLQEAISEALLELASAVGDSNLASSKTSLKHSLQTLDRLCGPEMSSRCVDAVTRWSSVATISEKVRSQPAPTLSEWKAKSDLATNLGANFDLISLTVKHKLEALCSQGKNKQLGGKLIESTVSAITMLGPGFGVPIAAQAMGASWGVANGGSEEAKLLRELYYHRQLDSRRQVFKDEAQFALLSYDQALATNNAALLVCSEALLTDIVGAAAVAQIIPTPCLPHGRGPVPMPIAAQN